MAILSFPRPDDAHGELTMLVELRQAEGQTFEMLHPTHAHSEFESCDALETNTATDSYYTMSTADYMDKEMEQPDGFPQVIRAVCEECRENIGHICARCGHRKMWIANSTPNGTIKYECRECEFQHFTYDDTRGPHSE